MKPVLLDANVLLALAWPNHPFHARARARVGQRGVRWATCLPTQAAFIRLSSNPAVVPGAKTPGEAGQMLERLLQDRAHHFLKTPATKRAKLGELLRRCHGHRQVNDAILIWIAVANGAVLLTFDKPLEHLAATAGAVEIIG